MKKYNQKQMRSRRYGAAMLWITWKGIWAMNRPAREQMKLSEFSGMEILHDDKKGHWYLCPSNADEALPINNGRNINCTVAARQLLKQLNTVDNTKMKLAAYPTVMEDGQEAWMIITSSARPTWHSMAQQKVILAEDCEI